MKNFLHYSLECVQKGLLTFSILKLQLLQFFIKIVRLSESYRVLIMLFLGLDPVNLLTGIRITLSVYHMPSLPMVPKLSNRVRPVSVASTLPIGAYMRALSMRDSHSIYLRSHLRVSHRLK